MSEIRNITVSTVQDVTFSSNMISDADIRAEYERRFGHSVLDMNAKCIIRSLKHDLHAITTMADSLRDDIENAESRISDNDGYKDSVHEALRNLPSSAVNEVESNVDEILNDLDYIEVDVDLDSRDADEIFEKSGEAERDIELLERLLGLEGDYTRDDGPLHDASDDREPALENMTELA